MCTEKDIDDILGQLAACKERKEKRSLLKTADPCGKCREMRFSAEQESDCSCVRQFRTTLQNNYYSLAPRTEENISAIQ